MTRLLKIKDEVKLISYIHFYEKKKERMQRKINALKKELRDKRKML